MIVNIIYAVIFIVKVLVLASSTGRAVEECACHSSGGSIVFCPVMKFHLGRGIKRDQWLDLGCLSVQRISAQASGPASRYLPGVKG